jgi:translation elongation factor EF-1alpha
LVTLFFNHEDKFSVPKRPVENPFRLSVIDFFRGGIGAGSSGSVSVRGRIEAGYYH